MPAKVVGSWMPRSASRWPFAQSDSLEVQGLGCFGFWVSGVQVLDFRVLHECVFFSFLRALFQLHMVAEIAERAEPVCRPGGRCSVKIPTASTTKQWANIASMQS